MGHIMNVMNKVLRDCIPDITIPFLDDIPIKGCSELEREESLDQDECMHFVSDVMFLWFLVISINVSKFCQTTPIELIILFHFLTWSDKLCMYTMWNNCWYYFLDQIVEYTLFLIFWYDCIVIQFMFFVWILDYYVILFNDMQTFLHRQDIHHVH